MAIKILGTNNQQEFERNSYIFDFFEQINAYKQTINPSISYTENPAEQTIIRDTFAKRNHDGTYTIIEYYGNNLISSLMNELARV